MSGDELVEGIANGAMVAHAVVRGDSDVVGVTQLDDETIELHAATSAEAIRTTYAFTQLVSSKLWADEGMRAGFIEFMTSQPTPGFVRVDDEHRSAVSFGKLVHAEDCTFALDEETRMPTGDCVEGCTTMPASEDDATLALIRVEVNVQPQCDARSPRGARCALPKGHGHA